MQSTTGHDNADRIVGITHSLTNNPVTYTLAYTPAGQVLTSTISSSTYVWPAPTSAAVTTTPDGLNRNANVGGVNWTWDANGNLRSDGTRTFSYDAENRLLTDVVGGSTVLSLSYDPLGRLQQSTAGSTVVKYLYDGDDLVAQYDGTGAVTDHWTHGPGVDDPVVWYHGTGLGIAAAHYLFKDNQGTIVADASTTGATTATFTYDPYGIPSTWTGMTQGFGYTGQLALPAAQLWHYKARAYDPVQGKFLQTDPVGYKNDVNLYVYVGDDPITRSDPSGLSACGNISGADCAAALQAQREAIAKAQSTLNQAKGWLADRQARR